MAATRCSVGNSGESSQANAIQMARSFAIDPVLFKVQMGALTQSPHPFGSPRQQQVTDWLESELMKSGLSVRRLPFTTQVPNPSAGLGGPASLTLERRGVNILALPDMPLKSRCLIIFASHYDTKEVSGISYVGANDSGSSTVGLLQVLAYLSRAKKGTTSDQKGDLCLIGGVFFDGEEAVLPNWDDGLSHPAKQQDNTYGSRSLANSLVDCPTAADVSGLCLLSEGVYLAVQAVVLFDMIGSPGLLLSRDANSSPKLLGLLEKSADLLGHSSNLGRVQTVSDDHIPFKEKGIPVLNLIDFNHIETWHAPGDFPESLSVDSVQTAMRLGLAVALQIPPNLK